MLFLLHQYTKVPHVLQLNRVSQVLVQSPVKTRFRGFVPKPFTFNLPQFFEAR